MTDVTKTFEERGQIWTRWAGGTEAPADWNGGRVLLASGEILHPYQQDVPFDWEQDVSETGCIEPGCIVGYTSTEHPQNPFATIPDPATVASDGGFVCAGCARGPEQAAAYIAAARGMREALERLIAACDRGRQVPKPGAGVCGMTIEAQMRATCINGVDAWPVEEAREAFYAFDATLGEQ